MHNEHSKSRVPQPLHILAEVLIGRDNNEGGCGVGQHGHILTEPEYDLAICIFTLRTDPDQLHTSLVQLVHTAFRQGGGIWVEKCRDAAVNTGAVHAFFREVGSELVDAVDTSKAPRDGDILNIPKNPDMRYVVISRMR